MSNPNFYRLGKLMESLHGLHELVRETERGFVTEGVCIGVLSTSSAGTRSPRGSDIIFPTPPEAKAALPLILSLARLRIEQIETELKASGALPPKS